jgi:SAM-dependent methyltransferase
MGSMMVMILRSAWLAIESTWDLGYNNAQDLEKTMDEGGMRRRNPRRSRVNRAAAALLQRERDVVGQLLARMAAPHVLQVGHWGSGPPVIERAKAACLVLATPWWPRGLSGMMPVVVCEPEELAVASESMDVVLLLHALDRSAQPHAVLREADRVLAPQGRLLITTRNPTSLWGLAHALGKRSRRGVPGQRRLLDWLALLGYEIETVRGVWFGPPTHLGADSAVARWVETHAAHALAPFGAVSVVVARKRIMRPMVIPLRPRRQRRLLGRGAVVATLHAKRPAHQGTAGTECLPAPGWHDASH